MTGFRITIAVEMDIDDFEFWSGGYTMAEQIKQHPKAWEYICEELEAWAQCEFLTPEMVNDYVWYDAERDLECAGLYDIETGKFTEEA